MQQFQRSASFDALDRALKLIEPRFKIAPRELLVAVALLAPLGLGTYALYESHPMSPIQGVILRAVVERVAEKSGRPVDDIWRRVEINAGVATPTALSRHGWHIAMERLVADLGP